MKYKVRFVVKNSEEEILAVQKFNLGNYETFWLTVKDVKSIKIGDSDYPIVKIEKADNREIWIYV